MTAPVVREEIGEGHRTPERAEITEWRTAYGLVAGITTRNTSGGDFNLGLCTPEAAAAVTARWRAVATSFATEFPGLTVSRPAHGSRIRQHDAGFEGCLVLDGYDGHVTREAGILLTVTVADCVPVYLADPNTGGIALVHAGWRGIAAGILERAIDRLAGVTGSPRDGFAMHCGVAISGPRYEVGVEVTDRLGVESSGSPRRVDLREVLTDRAHVAGIRHVTVSPWCTFDQSAMYFSHRRDGRSAGRMIAYLGRPLT